MLRRRQRRAAAAATRQPRRTCTIFCTCALSAPPQPATEFLTWFGVYCTTWQPNAAASASARPLAWPTLIAVRTLTWKKTCSTATTSRSELAQQRHDLGLQCGEALRQGIGRRRAQDAERHCLGRAGAGAVEHRVATPGEAGIDPEDALCSEHRFVL